MIIRKATVSDIPEMVDVLKRSMGDFDLPVSEGVWKYKHIDSPFGQSFILIAEENNKIIGVRALMQWQWQRGQQIFHSYRAVDTATDPNHQGRGIFKKLTLSAVDELKKNDAHFIFNTPNEKSRPGYLKMGWEPAGKLLVSLKPSYTFWNWGRDLKDYSIKLEATENERTKLCSNWVKHLQDSSALFTPKSSHYLKWRYEQNFLQKYEVISTSSYYLAAYVKKRKFIKELRIAECIFHETTSKEIFNVIAQLASKFGVHVISFSPQLLKIKLNNYKGNFGPMLTLRDLNLSPVEKTDFLDVTTWQYSLGDLELF